MLKKIAQKWSQISSQKVGSRGGIHQVKVTCFGGAQTVTGSNFMFEYQGKKILIDCGLPQGLDAHHREWIPFEYDASKVDYLLVTHAHMDHIGRIPFLTNSGFSGKIFSTAPTKDMTVVALADAFHILSKDFAKGKLDKMPYMERDIQASFAKWKSVDYRQVVHLEKNISVTFFNSSHVLGSAFIQISVGQGEYLEKFLFTGDMGQNSLLLPEADVPTDSGVVFMETVYGGRLHENVTERREKLRLAISEEIEKKGTLVIPAFAIERTQEILAEINDFIEEHKMPVIPVFLDAPLGIEVTKIFKKYKSMLNADMQEHIHHGDDIFKFKGLHFTESRDESMAINKIPGPKIVIAGSGMVAGGRVVHHVRQYLQSDKNTILLAGYQAMGTYGRLLTQGKKEIVFYGEALEVNAKIMQLTGYSAHRDQKSLLEFVSLIKNKCKSLNLILGDNESLDEFKIAVKADQGVDAHICMKGEVLEF